MKILKNIYFPEILSDKLGMCTKMKALFQVQEHDISILIKIDMCYSQCLKRSTKSESDKTN